MASADQIAYGYAVDAHPQVRSEPSHSLNVGGSTDTDGIDIRHREWNTRIGRDHFRRILRRHQKPALTKRVKAFVRPAVHLRLEDDAPASVTELDGLVDGSLPDGPILEVPIRGNSIVAA